jgi:hypothetical protein
MANLLISSKVVSLASVILLNFKMKWCDFVTCSFVARSSLSWVFESGAHIKQVASSCRLHELPLCVLVGLLGVIVDTPAIIIVAFCKMPIMLIKGWHRLLRDLVTRHGPCMEAACVPFAGLALVFWPFVVVASAITAVICSPILGLYSAVVVDQVCVYVTSTLFWICVKSHLSKIFPDFC